MDDGNQMAQPQPIEPSSPDFKPVRMDDVELGAPLPALRPSVTSEGVPFASSRCVVRLHGQPIGIVDVELPPEGVAAEALARRIEGQLEEEIRDHLRADGLSPERLEAGGLSMPAQPPCAVVRAERLREAPRVSVVICTRDRPDSVRETLGSILACEYPADRFEVIVVDNATERDTAVGLVASEFASKTPIKVVREPDAGLSNARNKGLEEAAGEIVVFADDDVEVDRNWVATLVAPFQRSPTVGATSGMTLPGTLETPTQLWIEGFGGREASFEVRVFDLAHPPPDRPLFPFTVGEFGAGRNMAFRAELLRRIGGFDPALGPGTVAHDGDDIEALMRVLLNGHSIVHDPAAIVWHAHPAEYEELEQRVWGYGIGLTACLTRALADHPSLFGDLVRKLPRGVAFALSTRSEKNRGRQADFPRILARRELLGMAYGPLAYLRSRWRQRREGRVRRDRFPPDGDRLRILVVSDEYWPVVGGAGRSIEVLAGAMAGRGHTVAVATAWQPEAPSREERDGVAVHRIRDLTSRMPWLSGDPYRHHAPPFPDPEAVWRLRRLVREFRPDVVHAYGWITGSATMALLGNKVPLLVSAHDYGNVCSVFTLVRRGVEPCSGPGPRKCLDCASHNYGLAKGAVTVSSVYACRPLIRRRMSRMHTVSGFVTEFMERTIDVPAEEIATIPNFLQDDQGEEPDGAILERLPKEPFIMFVGHLRPYKGLPRAARGLRLPHRPAASGAGWHQGARHTRELPRGSHRLDLRAACHRDGDVGTGPLRGVPQPRTGDGADRRAGGDEQGSGGDRRPGRRLQVSDRGREDRVARPAR